jgi:hypothetical protein
MSVMNEKELAEFCKTLTFKNKKAHIKCDSFHAVLKKVVGV